MFLSGAVRVIESPAPPVVPGRRRTAVTVATTTVSIVEPSPIVMVCPAVKPAALTTGRVVTPGLVAALIVVPPVVPMVAMVAVSLVVPVPIITFWPGLKPATLLIFTLLVSAHAGVTRVIAFCTIKSLQLLSLSFPSGKRPTLILV